MRDTKKFTRAAVCGLFTFLLFSQTACFLFTGNNNGNGEDDNGNGGGTSGEQNVVTSLSISAKDLGTEWSESITIAASSFSSMSSGDYITITTEASASTAEYFQIQFNDSSWSAIGNADCCTGIKSYSTEYSTYDLNSAENTIIFTPDATMLETIKSGGLIIKGYGITITKITLTLNLVNQSLLVNKNATANAVKVMNYLKNEVYGKKTLSGVMDCAWSNDIDMDAKVYNDTGYHTALMGFDFMELSKSSSQNWRNPTQIQEAKAWWNNGGLVTFCWHWMDPSNSDTISSSYKPEETSFRIPYNSSTDSLDTSSQAFNYIKSDLDTVATYLKELQDAGVVVIWRPLHEGAGNLGNYTNGTAWFWWGAGNDTSTVSTNTTLCGKAYIALWKYMYTYFTETKGLNNLIWLWNGQNSAFYPGDDYVDITGWDMYDASEGHGDCKTYYTKLNKISSNKMKAISECGYLPSSSKLKSYSEKWLFFMIWNDDDTLTDDTSSDNNNFWGGTKYNTTSNRTDCFDSDYVIKRGDETLNALFTSMGVF